MALRNYLAGEVAEDFAGGLSSRREALRRLGLLGLGVGAAASLLAACGQPSDSSAGAAGTAGAPPGRGPNTPRGTDIRFAGPAGQLRGAWAAPAKSAGLPKAGVLVVHENKGLTEHFYDLVGRFAGVGYGALCVDLLSAQGGTAALTDPAQPPAVLAAAPDEALLADLRSGISELARRVPGRKIGAVGFCFGGGMVWRLLAAGEARLAAAVPFYGPAPERPDFSRAKAAVLALYGQKDLRVNETQDAADAAMLHANLVHLSTVYPGADHAFFNDSGPRYDPVAAANAWQATIDWLGRYL
ncbi:MAG: dienelactone hydrolase family protein [Actinomycetota bacterium]|nr:dienelactone hydrolase family protein [Actinomycetota bacterium]